MLYQRCKRHLPTKKTVYVPQTFAWGHEVIDRRQFWAPTSQAVKMTIDKSLRVRAGSIRNRNVLTRVERLERLRDADRWKEGDAVLGLPKVRVQKVSLKKKKKVKKAEEEGGDEADS